MSAFEEKAEVQAQTIDRGTGGGSQNASRAAPLVVPICSTQVSPLHAGILQGRKRHRPATNGIGALWRQEEGAELRMCPAEYTRMMTCASLLTLPSRTCLKQPGARKLGSSPAMGAQRL